MAQNAVSHKYQHRNWPEIVRQWQESGLTPIEFCKKNQIHVNTFYSRKKQVLKKGVKTNGFIEISRNLLSQREIQDGYEIILPGAIHIRTSGNFHPVVLKNLIKAVKESWF